MSSLAPPRSTRPMFCCASCRPNFRAKKCSAAFRCVIVVGGAAALHSLVSRSSCANGPHIYYTMAPPAAGGAEPAAAPARRGGGAALKPAAKPADLGEGCTCSRCARKSGMGPKDDAWCAHTGAAVARRSAGGAGCLRSACCSLPPRSGAADSGATSDAQPPLPLPPLLRPPPRAQAEGGRHCGGSGGRPRAATQRPRCPAGASPRFISAARRRFLARGCVPVSRPPQAVGAVVLH